MAPGARLATSNPTQADSTQSAAHFAMIEVTVQSIDWLMISRQGHRRACFEWDNEQWQQTWLTP